LKIFLFAAAPLGCKDCRDSDESNGREGKVNLGNSEERVRDPREGNDNPVCAAGQQAGAD
jgi:hypothetical protein